MSVDKLTLPTLADLRAGAPLWDGDASLVGDDAGRRAAIAFFEGETQAAAVLELPTAEPESVRIHVLDHLAQQKYDEEEYEAAWEAAHELYQISCDLDLPQVLCEALEHFANISRFTDYRDAALKLINTHRPALTGRCDTFLLDCATIVARQGPDAASEMVELAHTTTDDRCKALAHQIAAGWFADAENFPQAYAEADNCCAAFRRHITALTDEEKNLDELSLYEQLKDFAQFRARDPHLTQQNYHRGLALVDEAEAIITTYLDPVLFSAAANEDRAALHHSFGDTHAQKQCLISACEQYIEAEDWGFCYENPDRTERSQS
ncbi:MAG: hypothetical protein Q4D85_11090 [Corynebacterium sp.]|uniref:hypothetical protein n=1 Tax=Corynebacterium sp. TaxID=1720 RepID=UPI0026DBDC33|nr:hypothetical protein [Corynebacterium sp.]MDO5099279.1 hypothetical protein [Corynebacterium sp.]